MFRVPAQVSHSCHEIHGSYVNTISSCVGICSITAIEVLYTAENGNINLIAMNDLLALGLNMCYLDLLSCGFCRLNHLMKPH